MVCISQLALVALFTFINPALPAGVLHCWFILHKVTKVIIHQQHLSQASLVHHLKPYLLHPNPVGSLLLCSACRVARLFIFSCRQGCSVFQFVCQCCCFNTLDGCHFAKCGLVSGPGAPQSFQIYTASCNHITGEWVSSDIFKSNRCPTADDCLSIYFFLEFS